MLKDIDSRLVGESNVPEVHVALYLRHFLRTGDIVYGYRLVHHLEDTLQVRHRIDERIHQVGKVHQRLPESRGVIRHGDNCTERYGAGTHADKSHAENERAHDYGHDVRARPYQVGVGHRLHPGLLVLFRELVVDLGVFFLTGEHLGDLDSHNAFVQVRVQIGALVGYLLPCLTLSVLYHDHDERVHRESCHCYKSQLPVYEEHEYGYEQQIDHLKDEVDQSVRHKVGYSVDVIDDPREYLSVRSAVVILKAQPLHVLEQVFSDVIDDVLSDFCHHHRAYFRKDDADNDTCEHRNAAQDYVLHAVVRTHRRGLIHGNHIIVDSILHDHRGKQSDDGAERAQDKRDSNPLLVLRRVNQRTLQVTYVERGFKHLIHVEFVSCHAYPSLLLKVVNFTVVAVLLY